MRFILKLVISAAVFALVLPMIPGIDFHGNFWPLFCWHLPSVFFCGLLIFWR